MLISHPQHLEISLLLSDFKLTGAHLKFLRTYVNLSYDSLSHVVDVPASTLRSWESKKDEPTGFEDAKEKVFRSFVNNKMAEARRIALDRSIILNPLDGKDNNSKPIDMGAALLERVDFQKN